MKKRNEDGKNQGVKGKRKSSNEWMKSSKHMSVSCVRKWEEIEYLVLMRVKKNLVFFDALMFFYKELEKKGREGDKIYKVF